MQVTLGGGNNWFRPDWPEGQIFDPAPTLVRDHWVPIEFFIDLDNDYQESHYNGQLTSAGRWSGRRLMSHSTHAHTTGGRSGRICASGIML